MAREPTDAKRVADLEQAFGVDAQRARKMAALEQGELKADVDGLDYTASHADEVADWTDREL
jgi:hypothetical protein